MALPTQITNYSTLRRHCALNITIIVTVAIIITIIVTVAIIIMDDKSFTADNASDILILPIVSIGGT